VKQEAGGAELIRHRHARVPGGFTHHKVVVIVGHSVAPAATFVPVIIITAVPPAAGRLFGATLLTVCDAHNGSTE
jgi:hypothetical protein